MTFSWYSDPSASVQDVDKLGVREIIDQTIETLRSCTEGMHLSFDVDVVDEKEAPGVNAPVHGGITFREAHLAMEMLSDAKVVTSLDVVEVNQKRDIANTTSQLVIGLICSLLGKKIYG